MPRLLFGLMVFVMLFTAAAVQPALGQAAPAPVDGPTVNATNVPPSAEDGLSDTIAKLSEQLETFLDYLTDDIQKALLDYFQYIALALGIVICLVSFLREGSKGTDIIGLGRFFLRSGLFLAFIFGSQKALLHAQHIGNLLAYGTEAHVSPLQRWQAQEQEKFQGVYRRFCLNQFCVKIQGQDEPFAVQDEDGQFWLGVITSKETEAKSLNELKDQFDPDQWHLSKVLSLFHLTRFLLEIGDLFLLIESFLIFLALSLLCPFMCAAAVDSEGQNQISKKYLWGALVFTLAFPAFSQVVRFLAYFSGNFVLSLGTDKPSYIWNSDVMAAIGSPGSPAVYLAIAGFIIMIFFCLMLPATPMLVYAMSMGRVYESAGNFGAQWFGAAAGLGTSLWFSIGGAQASQLGELASVKGQYESGETRADTKLQTDNRRAELTAAREHSNIQAYSVGAMGSARAQLQTSLGTANSLAGFSRLSLGTDIKRTDRQLENGVALQQAQNDRGADADSLQGGFSIAGSLFDIAGRGLTGGFGVPAPPKGGTDAAPPAGGGIPSGGGHPPNLGGFAQGAGQVVVPQLRAGAQNEILRSNLQEQVNINSQFEREQAGNINLQQQMFKNVAHESYGTQVASIQAGAGIQHGAVNRQLAGEKQNNQAVYSGEMKALAQMEAAGRESALQRRNAETMRAVGGALSKVLGDLFEQNKIH